MVEAPSLISVSIRRASSLLCMKTPGASSGYQYANLEHHCSQAKYCWFGHRTLAVMDREDFAVWLRSGGDLIVDDLTWTTQGRTARVAIDGHRTCDLDDPTLAGLIHRA